MSPAVRILKIGRSKWERMSGRKGVKGKELKLERRNDHAGEESICG